MRDRAQQPVNGEKGASSNGELGSRGQVPGERMEPRKQGEKTAAAGTAKKPEAKDGERELQPPSGGGGKAEEELAPPQELHGTPDARPGDSGSGKTSGEKGKSPSVSKTSGASRESSNDRSGQGEQGGGVRPDTKPRSDALGGSTKAGKGGDISEDLPEVMPAASLAAASLATASLATGRSPMVQPIRATLTGSERPTTATAEAGSRENRASPTAKVHRPRGAIPGNRKARQATSRPHRIRPDQAIRGPAACRARRASPRIIRPRQTILERMIRIWNTRAKRRIWPSSTWSTKPARRTRAC